MKTTETVAYRDMLEIVFTDRNKAYGAYQLRRAYSNHLGFALLIALGLIYLVFVAPTLLQGKSTATVAKPDIITKPTKNIKIEITKPKNAIKSAMVSPKQQFVVPIVTPDNKVAQKPTPTIAPADITAEVAATTTQGDPGEQPPTLVDPVPIDGGGDGTTAVPSMPEPDPDEIHVTAEVQPAYPGGEAALLRYLASEIRYPQYAQETGVKGRVYVQFVVERDGQVSDVHTVRDIGGGCGREAERVIRAMPRWSPGMQNGRAVRVKYTLPVLFQLK